MTTLSNIARQTGKILVDNSPAILTGLGAAGVVSTAVLASKASFEASEVISQYWENSESSDVDFREKLKATWKLFIPAAAVGTVSIVCIISANSISSRRNAALISLYTLTEGAFQEYKEKVVEQIGNTREQKVRDEVAQDRVNASSGAASEIVIIGNGDVLCYDAFTGRYFQSNVEAIRKAQNDINLKCINEMYASQNDFYQKIGLPSVENGELVGWNTDNEMELQFSAVLSEDNRPCIVMNYRKGPIPNFYKVW